MNFIKVKVKASTDINAQNNEPNCRIEPLILSKSIIWFLVVLISLNSAFLSISPVILNSSKNQIKFE